jgi:hypothetical protein
MPKGAGREHSGLVALGNQENKQYEKVGMTADRIEKEVGSKRG